MSVASVLINSILLATLVLHCQCNQNKIHIVYMGEVPKDIDVSMSSIHHSMLTDVLGSHAAATESLLHSYGWSFNGFSAKLSDEQVAKLKGMDGVVSVFPSSRMKLHTTRSWDFLGLKKSYLARSNSKGGDVIVGMTDTGIWPEAESLNDKGFGPPPTKWNGICQTAENFPCNNKVTGARYYNMAKNCDFDFKSARDIQGHGTHTASTAAGNIVEGASFYGLAEGLARGALPSARLAVYKVCWSYSTLDSCTDADILAASDDSIADGIDIISVSLGGSSNSPYLEDVNSIGSFHAMRKGILTSFSAGNSGPISQSVVNIAPWSLTVAASSIDRRFMSNLVLGNGKYIVGAAINSFDLNGKFFHH